MQKILKQIEGLINERNTFKEKLGQVTLDCEIAETKALELEEERDMLAYENKNMAEFIQFNDKSLNSDDISDIANSTCASGIWDRYISVNSFKEAKKDLEEEV